MDHYTTFRFGYIGQQVNEILHLGINTYNVFQRPFFIETLLQVFYFRDIPKELDGPDYFTLFIPQHRGGNTDRQFTPLAGDNRDPGVCNGVMCF